MLPLKSSTKSCFGTVFNHHDILTLDIVLSSQKELVDNVKIHEPLGNSDHNQIHFDINVKSESKNKKTYRRNFHKGNYKDMRKY